MELNSRIAVYKVIAEYINFAVAGIYRRTLVGIGNFRSRKVLYLRKQQKLSPTNFKCYTVYMYTQMH